jgi:hypothetical protein
MNKYVWLMVFLMGCSAGHTSYTTKDGTLDVGWSDFIIKKDIDSVRAKSARGDEIELKGLHKSTEAEIVKAGVEAGVQGAAILLKAGGKP